MLGDKQEQTVRSDSTAIQAGGNVTLNETNNLIISVDDIQSSDYKLYKIIQNKLESIDNYVAKHITGVQAHKKHSPEPFKSIVVIESMGRLGIPITAGIKAISVAVNIIVQEHEAGSLIKTSQVRKAITEALYGLNEDEYHSEDIERWAESYIRRYGTETLIKVIDDLDGEKLKDKDLVVKYLIETVIPDVMRFISEDVRKINDISKVASNNMLRRMANDILEAVHSLNLYRIHYDVLFALVKEMALQPPHPWFAPTVRSYEHINYDYEKYKLNYRKVLSARSYGDKNKLLYGLKETTHHCCSAILAYYSIYMGCGTLAPLHVLIEILQDICRHDTNDSEILFRISEVEHDFNNIQIKVENFNALLKRIRKKLEIEKRKDDLAIESLFLDVKDLYDITTTLIASFIRKQRQKEVLKNRHDLTLDDIFLGFPHLNWDWHTSKEAFWVTHHYDTPIFSQIKPRILIVPLSETQIETTEIINQWLNEAKINSLTCNLIFFISKRNIQFHHVDSQSYNVYVAFFTFDELIQISTKEKPWVVLEKLLPEKIISV